jgi:hypothetical protein
MLMRSVLAVAFLVLAAGCTPMQWIKPDTAAAEGEKDLAACRQEAWRESRLSVPFFPRPLPYIVRDAQGRQFLVSPIGFHDPFNDQFMEENRLTTFCMRSKGYELKAIEKDATKK